MSDGVKKNTGGSAFPVLDSETDKHGDPIGDLICRDYGMTLRDYFAGQALIGLVNNLKEYSKAGYIMVAHHAYRIADAMITERGGSNG